MPLSDYDHVEALRARLLEVIHAKEQELRELQDKYNVLGETAKLVSSMVLGVKATEEPGTGHKTQNRNVTALVREYIATHPGDEVIKAAPIIKYLQSRGIKGKYRNLYSQVHVILGEERDKKVLRHEKGIGFFKRQQAHV